MGQKNITFPYGKAGAPVKFKILRTEDGAYLDSDLSTFSVSASGVQHDAIEIDEVYNLSIPNTWVGLTLEDDFIVTAYDGTDVVGSGEMRVKYDIGDSKLEINDLATAGASPVSITGSTNKKFVVGTSSTTFALFTTIEFGFSSTEIIISNDSDTEDIDYSFDGSTVDGTLKAQETITLSGKQETQIDFQSTSGGDGFRLWAH
jgi:hypothetical protein